MHLSAQYKVKVFGHYICSQNLRVRVIIKVVHWWFIFAISPVLLEITGHKHFSLECFWAALEDRRKLFLEVFENHVQNHILMARLERVIEFWVNDWFDVGRKLLVEEKVSSCENIIVFDRPTLNLLVNHHQPVVNLVHLLLLLIGLAHWNQHSSEKTYHVTEKADSQHFNEHSVAKFRLGEW